MNRADSVAMIMLHVCVQAIKRHVGAVLVTDVSTIDVVSVMSDKYSIYRFV
jgi:hypothetical protein